MAKRQVPSANGVMRFRNPLVGVSLVATLLMAGCGQDSRKPGADEMPSPAQVALDAESQAVAKKIEARFHDFLVTNKVPTGAKVTLRWVKKSPVEGMYEAMFTIQMKESRGQSTFFFDKEAKHFFLGPVYTMGEVLRKRVPANEMVLQDRPALGPDTAPVTIVEYSDFQCPYCSVAAGTIRTILKKYKSDVRFVFKHMPLAAMHPWAYDAAVLSECAAAQKPEAFWYYHDYFFDPAHGITKENFIEKTENFAKTVNLDVEKLRKCVKKGEPKWLIDADLAEAVNFGFTATPTFVINGVVVVGNQPLSTFEEVIQEQLIKMQKKVGKKG